MAIISTQIIVLGQFLFLNVQNFTSKLNSFWDKWEKPKKELFFKIEFLKNTTFFA